MAGKDYLRLRQICLVARDLQKAEDDVRAIFGSEACYHDPNVGKYGLQNALFPLGDKLLEVVVPTRDGTAAGRFLDRFGERGGYMVIMDCSDVERRREHVTRLQIPIINTLDYDGFLAIQLHPRVCRAAMLEFNRTAGGDTTAGPYHPAGPNWPSAAKLPATARLKVVEVESPDPVALGKRWAEIIELPLNTGATRFIEFEDARIVFVPGADATQERLIGLGVAVADPARSMEAARKRGLVDAAGDIWLYGVRIKLESL
jgi:hypothetical protein